jgi:hypothetical protein
LKEESIGTAAVLIVCINEAVWQLLRSPLRCRLVSLMNKGERLAQIE